MSSPETDDEAKSKLENRMKRGSGSTSAEATYIAQAWVFESENAVLGTEWKEYDF